MPTQYGLSQRAYVTLLLHALKHPSQAVNGVLLGPAPGPASGTAAGSSPPGSPRGGSAGVRLTEAVPLFHGTLALSPPLEVALTQARPARACCIRSVMRACTR